MADEPREEGQEQQAADPNAEWETQRAEYERKLQEAQQREAQWNQRYNQDIGTLSAYAQSLAQSQQQPPQPPEEIDEETPEGRKKARELLQRQLQEAQNAHLQAQYQNQKQQSRYVVAQKYGKEWDRWGGEVEQMLNGYPLAVSASPDAYEAAFRAVKALHQDEILEEKKREWLAARAERDGGEGEEELEGAGSLPSPSPSAVSPVRTTSSPGRVAASNPKRREKGPWDALPREQQAWLKDRGMTAEEFNKYADPNYEADVMGFKGRHVIGDEDFTSYHGR